MKRLLLILLIPLLALVLISCDQDMRSGIAGFLGGFGGNAFVDSGLVSENTTNAEAAGNHIAALGTGGNAGAVGDDGKIDKNVFGIDISLTSIDEVTSFLAPQGKEEQDALKEQLGDTLNSPKQKDKFKKDMAAEATTEQKEAAKGTTEILNAVLDELKGDNDDLGFLDNLKLPEIDDETELTQGDILILQLMTDLVANTINTFNDIAGDGDLSGLSVTELQEHIDELMNIIDDALFAAQMADELSGSSNIDFTGGLDLATLLGQMTSDRSSRALARADGGNENDFNIAEMLPALFGLSKDITSAMGAKISEGTVTIDEGTYQSFLLMMRAYRSSLEYAFTIVDSDSIKPANLNNDEHIDLSTAIKYFLALLLTENDEYLKTRSLAKNSLAILEEFLNKNLEFVTGVKPAEDDYEPEMPEGMESTYEGFQGYIESKDGLNETVQKTLMGINKFAGSTQLEDLLKDFNLSAIFGDDGEDD